ncbi:MAG: ABC transporter ATP-binding protein [Peptococcaceae bacterium]|nr:ABC transporter ATP-binding protein [Peptococcaceae bacterium]
MQEVLSVQDLEKTFTLSAKQRKIERTSLKKKVAVNKISFTAQKGEIFGLLGPNGAGKTTTLRILSTLMTPDAGDAFIDGISIRKNPHEIRKRIGFLTSELKLDDFFTPNYLYDFFANLYKVDLAASQKRKKDLFDRLGISKFAEVKIANLSTGMKQKASLAVSTAHDPDMMIFDEPTNGLDIITAKIVTDFLLELKERGKTIILSTHIFSLVEKVCNRVGIIIDGKMAACDSLENLTVNASLENVFFDLYEKMAGGERDE